jgi:hypothetical protein
MFYHIHQLLVAAVVVAVMIIENLTKFIVKETLFCFLFLPVTAVTKTTFYTGKFSSGSTDFTISKSERYGISDVFMRCSGS